MTPDDHPNLLTVDLEEWFHLDDRVVPPGRWDQLPGRVADNTRALLDLLDRCSARATFFVLGWAGARDARLLAEIAARGHELATHGYLHRSVADLGEAEFVADLRRAREVVESASGRPVVGFRAARWSLGGRPGKGRWGRAAGMCGAAIDILIREGFRYDSSLAPIVHVGDPDWPVDPYLIERPSGTIREFPPLVGRWLGARLLLGSGWALRRAPDRVIRRAIADRNRRGSPAVLVLHAWEIDPDPPRLPMPIHYRVAHYGGLKGWAAKIEALLQGRRWAPIADVLDGPRSGGRPGGGAGAAAAPRRGSGGPSE